MRGMVGVFLVGLLMAAPAGAALTQYWTVESPEDFLKCSGRGSARGGAARAEVGPSVDSLGDVGEPLVWTVCPGGKGVVFAGTGHAGKIYRSSGSGFKEFASTGESEVLSLVPDGRGGVFAGTGPKGRIYHVDATGKSSLLCELKAEYVWALLADRDGSLFAATGAMGRIYHVRASGAVEEYWTSPAGHAVCLAWSGSHTLLAGGEEDGILYEITASGKGRALFDSGEKEIHSIAVTPSGEIYVAALKVSLPSPGAPGPAAAGPSPSGLEKGQKSSIWKLLPNGAGTRVWDGPGLAFALLAQGGYVYAATGEEAQLLRLSPDGSWSRLLDLDPASILCATLDGPDLLLGTSTPGQVYRVRPSRAASGRVDSYTLDGKRVSRWGGLFHESRGGGAARFMVRSGNSEVPDAGWSDWQPYQGGNISAPAARYLQWRAELSGAIQLARVRVAYREQNLAPEMSPVRVLPQEPKALLGPPDAGSVSQTLSGGLKVEYSLPRSSLRPQTFDVSAWARGIRHIRWDASDPNGDPLHYDVDFREAGAAAWKPLGRALEETLLPWDVTSVPDGVYEIRVTASDSALNVPSEARVAFRVSEPVTVDHSMPAWRGLSGERSGDHYRLKGAAHDERSPLVYLAYSVDGGDWVLAEPVDGVLDSPDEEVSFDTLPVARGEHTVVLKAVDLSGNVGAANLNLH